MRATDIRAGVGLVIAGLVADGVTEVAEIHHIDRGYVRFEEQLRALGADVERVESSDVRRLSRSLAVAGSAGLGRHGLAEAVGAGAAPRVALDRGSCSHRSPASTMK